MSPIVVSVAVSPLVLALIFGGAALPSATQDEKLVLKREFKAGLPLKFKTTHAETFKVAGEPAADLTFHGDATIEVSATPTAPGAETFELAVAYLAGTGNRWVGAAKDPEDSVKFEGRQSAARPDGRKTSLAKDRVLDAGDGWPRLVGLSWFDGALSPANRLAGGVSAVGGDFATHQRLNFAFPPLAAEPLEKDGRHDADFVLGYLGQEAQLQVFYASFAKSWNEKSATFAHSGKPRLVKFDRPASRPAKPLEVALDEEKSAYSATCEVSRVDGAVLKREGEITLVFNVADPAMAGAPKVVTAKLWTKLERL